MTLLSGLFRKTDRANQSRRANVDPDEVSLGLAPELLRRHNGHVDPALRRREKENPSLRWISFEKLRYGLAMDDKEALEHAHKLEAQYRESGTIAVDTFIRLARPEFLSPYPRPEVALMFDPPPPSRKAKPWEGPLGLFGYFLGLY